VLPHQLPACARADEELPGLTFVLDHLGKPPIASGALEPWASGLRALAALPNTVTKLSGLVTEAVLASWTVEDLRPYADVALEAFGPERLMHGSDWPVPTLAVPYGDTLDLTRRLTDPRDRAQILETTATRVYGLWTGSASRVGGRNCRTYVRSQHAPVSRSSRHVV
jgi:L-fuconolactonase